MLLVASANRSAALAGYSVRTFFLLNQKLFFSDSLSHQKRKPFWRFASPSPSLVCFRMAILWGDFLSRLAASAFSIISLFGAARFEFLRMIVEILKVNTKLFHQRFNSNDCFLFLCVPRRFKFLCFKLENFDLFLQTFISDSCHFLILVLKGLIVIKRMIHRFFRFSRRI